MVMNQRQSYLIDGKKSGAMQSPDKTLLSYLIMVFQMFSQKIFYLTI